jgi:cell division protein FtsA
MSSDRLVAALDIGSSHTTAVIAEVAGDLPRRPTLRVLGVGTAKTAGFRRGVVSDIEETTRAIAQALGEAERMAGQRVDSLYVGIAGEHVETMTSQGIVAVNGDEITRADVDRANDVARAQPVPRERELLHAIPQEYTVDKNLGVRDPVGMVGTRLETEMYLVTVGSSPANNLRKAVEKAGYSTKALVLAPLASALATLTEDEKELGVVLVEMGSGTTDVAVFLEGKIRHVATINLGGQNVSGDIVHGLGVTPADADRLKEEYGCAYEPMIQPGQFITLPSTVTQGDRQIPYELLAHIIQQRTDEIFDHVQRDLERAGFAKQLNAGVVVTGGASVTAGIAELASDLFGQTVRIGSPMGIDGLIEAVGSPRFSCVVGLAQFAAGRVALAALQQPAAAGKRPGSGTPAGMNQIVGKVKEWFQDFF